MKNAENQLIKSFLDVAEWRQWLGDKYVKEDGLWIKFAKKASGIPSVTPAEALEVALCYGWIDGQRQKWDDNYYLNKYTPRRSRSLWSKRNCEIALRLITEKQMRTSGLEQIKLAKADGRWEKAYDSPSKMEVPNDFLKELKTNEKAYAFFKTLNKTNIFAIGFRLQTAKKPETRVRRMKKILDMMKNGEKFH